MRNNRLVAATTALAMLLLGGCTHIGVAAYDRDLLARSSMALNPDPHVTAFHDHIYFSKEGSTGGRSSQGGGCGCN